MGLDCYCKPCRNAKMRATITYAAARKNYLKHRYGITPAEYQAMYDAQDGKCAICKKTQWEFLRGRNRSKYDTLYIDHDHATARIRGLLCFNCNGALGQFRDRTDLMLRAVAYLRRGAWAELIDQPGVQVGFHAGNFEDPRRRTSDAPPDDRGPRRVGRVAEHALIGAAEERR